MQGSWSRKRRVVTLQQPRRCVKHRGKTLHARAVAAPTVIAGRTERAQPQRELQQSRREPCSLLISVAGKSPPAQKDLEWHSIISLSPEKKLKSRQAKPGSGRR